MKKRRLDKVLVERGCFADEGEALRAIKAHEVKVAEEYATSPAQLVAPDAEVSVKRKSAYVSRGGGKLQAALQAFHFNVTGLHCADIGCSTGGFTDCLLQAGAASVAAVDVGYGLLAWQLRQDPRVTVHERTNIRIADPAELGAPFDLVVADLSFIGLASLAPTFAQLTRQGGTFIGLIKPQFESRHEETDARGVVRDEHVRARTVAEVRDALASAGFQVHGVIESPIRGKQSGNIEYLVMASNATASNPTAGNGPTTQRKEEHADNAS